jgi:hypothetical protein
MSPFSKFSSKTNRLVALRLKTTDRVKLIKEEMEKLCSLLYVLHDHS